MYSYAGEDDGLQRFAVRALCGPSGPRCAFSAAEATTGPFRLASSARLYHMKAAQCRPLQHLQTPAGLYVTTPAGGAFPPLAGGYDDHAKVECAEKDACHAMLVAAVRASCPAPRAAFVLDSMYLLSSQLLAAAFPSLQRIDVPNPDDSWQVDPRTLPAVRTFRGTAAQLLDRTADDRVYDLVHADYCCKLDTCRKDLRRLLARVRPGGVLAATFSQRGQAGGKPAILRKMGALVRAAFPAAELVQQHSYGYSAGVTGTQVTGMVFLCYRL